MPRKYRSIFVYLGTSLAIAIVTIAVVSGFAASQENEQSLVNQQAVVQHETDEVYRQIEGQLSQMIFWQDAYENIVRQWNQKWVAYQFGPYQETMGNHLVAIYGPSGQLLFLHAGGRFAHISSTDLANANGLTLLLKSVASERMRQPPALHKGITLIDGIAYFAVAGTVTPEQTNDLALAQQHPFHVVFFAPVMTANYDALTKGFAVYDTGIVVGDKRSSEFVAAPLADAAGRPLAWLQWKVQLPGESLLKTVLPAMIGVLLLLALLQGMIVRRWQNMQRELFMADAMAQSAKEESRAKSVFLGTISHELRTPLNAIIGFSDVLLNRLFGPLGSPRYEEYAAHIRSSGYLLLKTVNDLIEIARIEARDTAVEQQRVDAALAAQLAIEGAVKDALRKNVELFLSAVHDGAWCRGSELSLRQAIGRVLDNAIRYSPEGAVVTVAVQRDGNNITVEVRDVGDGIAPERLAALGQPFGSPESHLVKGNGGPGLGLSIAKGLIRLMGGTLSIASKMGAGTTVTLRLPRDETPASYQYKAA
ncbi:MAG: HAMP domain-containing sensor histidine kinase [Rhizomicrobium sp.]